MTDAVGAISALRDVDCKERNTVLTRFYQQWKNDPHVLDYWFEQQASSKLPGTLMQVANLLNHEAFDITNPNKIRSLIRNFCRNLSVFHNYTGDGYFFLADFIKKLDSINSVMAADLIEHFNNWQRYDKFRQIKMKQALASILECPDMSKNVCEMASKCLGEPVPEQEFKQNHRVLEEFLSVDEMPARLAYTMGTEQPKNEEKNDGPTTRQMAYGAVAALVVGYGIFRFFKQPETMIAEVLETGFKKML
jgi:hypothetical protein